MKNFDCRGCDYYIIGGPRRCSAVQQKYYEEFKKVCPCRTCIVRITCKIKVDYVVNRDHPKDYCSNYDQQFTDFIGSIPGYYENTSYGDPKWHDRNNILKRNMNRVIELIIIKK